MPQSSLYWSKLASTYSLVTFAKASAARRDSSAASRRARRAFNTSKSDLAHVENSGSSPVRDAFSRFKSTSEKLIHLGTFSKRSHLLAILVLTFSFFEITSWRDRHRRAYN